MEVIIMTKNQEKVKAAIDEIEKEIL